MISYNLFNWRPKTAKWPDIIAMLKILSSEENEESDIKYMRIVKYPALLDCGPHHEIRYGNYL